MTGTIPSAYLLACIGNKRALRTGTQNWCEAVGYTRAEFEAALARLEELELVAVQRLKHGPSVRRLVDL